MTNQPTPKKRRRFLWKAIVVTIMACGLLATAVAQQWERPKPTGSSVSIEHGGQEREYRIHVPIELKKDAKVPLVVCLHGGGGTSLQVSGIGLSKVADQHQFIVVYPGGINKHWNDGRASEKFREQDQQVDDVAFIKAVIEQVIEQHPIDEARVFVCGISNGGFMTQRMAIEAPELFAAAGVFVATIGKPLDERFEPKLPVSVMFMNGTADPLVPYEGGSLTINLFPSLRMRQQKPNSHGACISTDDAVAMWVERNKITTKPTVTQLADKVPDDGSQVELQLWKDGEQGTAVALYKVIGGGHTIPGGQQYLPESMIGKTNHDIDGLEVMWQFFVEHGRETQR